MTKIVAAILLSIMTIFLQFGSSSLQVAKPNHAPPMENRSVIRLIGKFNPNSQMHKDLMQIESVNTYGFTADSKYAYLSTNYGLYVIDFFYPEGPKVITRKDNLSGKMKWNPSHYLFFYPPGDFLNFDVSDPTKITMLWAYYSKDADFDIRDLVISGNYAYTLLGDRTDPYNQFDIFCVWDFTNPANIQLIGTSMISPNSIFEYRKIAVYGSHAYVVGFPGHGNTFFDISDKTHPRMIYQAPYPGLGYHNQSNIAVHGNLLLIPFTDSLDNGYVYALDVTDPANPRSLPNPLTINNENWYAMQMIGTTVILAGGSKGLFVVDYSDPSHPQVVRNIIETGFAPSYLAINGNYLYVADSEANIWLFQLNFQSISGKIQDENGAPLEGIQISNGAYSELTDDTGVYHFDGLSSSTYQIIPSTQGYVFAPAQHTVTVPPSTTSQDFTAILPSISGRVKTLNGLPYPGATIDMGSGTSLTSDRNGVFEVKGVTPGSFTLTPSQPGYSFSPVSAGITLPPYHAYQDFTILPPPIVQTVTPDQPTVLTLTDVQGTVTTITIPAGAVDVPTEIHLIPVVLPRQSGLYFAGHSFDLVAYQQGVKVDPIKFSQPIQVSTEFSAWDSSWVEDAQKLAWFMLSGGNWSLAKSTCDQPSELVDPENRATNVAICSTGTFGLFGPPKHINLPLVTR
jgi:hypothetical protein